MRNQITEEKPRRGWSTRKKVFVALGIFAIMVLIAAGTSIWLLTSAVHDLMHSACSTEEPGRFSAAEDLAHFHFPPSATNLSVSCWGMQGWYAEARFDMLPQDLNTFVASTRVTISALTTQIPVFGTLTPPKDIATEAISLTHYLYGVFKEPEFEQDILIDTTNPQQYHVHILVLAG